MKFIDIYAPLALLTMLSFNLSHAGTGVSGAYGASLNHHDIFASDHNPAMGSFMVSKNERWRISYLGAYQIAVEFGDVNNFADELDELIDILDDPDGSSAPVNETLDRFNRLLIDMGDNGYIHTQTDARLPLIHTFYQMNTLTGTLGFSSQHRTNISARVLDDELEIIDERFVTSSSLYLKGAKELQFSANYSLPVWSLENFGDVYIGAKFKIIQTELSKQVSALQDLDGEAVDEIIKQQYDDNLRSSTNISIDLGAVLEANRYRLGITIFDISSPSFNYGDVGINCERLDEPSDERTSCELAAFFANDKREISTREKHTKRIRGSIFASAKITDAWWFNSSYDLSEYENIVGFENQHLTLSTTYNRSSNFFSGARLAYESNLSRDGLDSIAIGFTFFSWLSLDLTAGLDNVDIDGNSAPRKLGFALNISEQF